MSKSLLRPDHDRFLFVDRGRNIRLSKAVSDYNPVKTGTCNINKGHLVDNLEELDRGVVMVKE